MKLRELFIQIVNIDPFQYISVALSVCQAIYRSESEFLPENTICEIQWISPSIKWLKYISFTQNIDIKHACNGGD